MPGPYELAEHHDLVQREETERQQSRAVQLPHSHGSRHSTLQARCCPSRTGLAAASRVDQEVCLEVQLVFPIALFPTCQPYLRYYYS